ncbi:hypothetical protein Psuf_023100 [Phytohabitans suffuscus]|uniref:Uncharacterized protein n=1 Tax=Phytohabitans suffuscus TaxID=624315 RepID=A0A6F8YFZ9_9ACTN|nr:hypothetical protein Psuf_023100 [Phytohabitans suffuscus]
MDRRCPARVDEVPGRPPPTSPLPTTIVHTPGMANAELLFRSLNAGMPRACGPLSRLTFGSAIALRRIPQQLACLFTLDRRMRVE